LSKIEKANSIVWEDISPAQGLNILLGNLEKKLKKVKIEDFIIHHEQVRVFEYVKNKKMKERPSKVYSITKSIISLLIGILLDKEMIQVINQPIYSYFPDLLKCKETRKKQITIAHLLTMTSGFEKRPFQGSKNWVNFLLQQPIRYDPGTVFQYNSGDSHLLSAIIRKVSGMSTAAFAEKYLFNFLGIKKINWIKDPQGVHGGGFSLLLTLEDMVKIGTLLLEDGKYANKQLLSSNWIHQAQMTRRQLDVKEFGVYGYGYQFWTFNSANTERPLNYFYANGIFGQYIFIVPKYRLTATVKAHLLNENQSLPRLLFEEFLREIEPYFSHKI
jgi:CubicO group peptidase (beta-lactamase class C family)